MQKGVILGGERLEWHEALRRAHDPLRSSPYPADFLTLMRDDETDPDREPGVESFTPTRLMGCHRQAVLMAGSDYYVDADQAWPLVRGHMVHALMERASYPGVLKALRETRLATTVDTCFGPQRFTAKPDVLLIDRIAWVKDMDEARTLVQRPVLHLKVVDYKSKNDIKHDLTEVAYEHELQVNMYAWVAMRELPALLDLPGAEVVVDELEIVYCDMRRVRRFTSAGPLTAAGKRLNRTRPYEYETLTLAPIRLWSPDKVGRFITRRIEERIAARYVLPDPLSGDDVWRCDYCPVRTACLQLTENKDGCFR